MEKCCSECSLPWSLACHEPIASFIPNISSWSHQNFILKQIENLTDTTTRDNPFSLWSSGPSHMEGFVTFGRLCQCWLLLMLSSMIVDKRVTNRHSLLARCLLWSLYLRVTFLGLFCMAGAGWSDFVSVEINICLTSKPEIWPANTCWHLVL